MSILTRGASYDCMNSVPDAQQSPVPHSCDFFLSQGWETTISRFHADSLTRYAGRPVPFARSQARHKYQLATLRNGAHFFPLFNSTSALGKSAAASARVFGTL